jgi:hypothetical protein
MPEDHLPAIINPPAPPELRRELEHADGYAQSALAPATRQACERDWLVFATWCAQRGVPAIPATPTTVAAFLAGEADPSRSGAARRRSRPRTARRIIRTRAPPVRSPR